MRNSLLGLRGRNPRKLLLGTLLLVCLSAPVAKAQFSEPRAGSGNDHVNAFAFDPEDPSRVYQSLNIDPGRFSGRGVFARIFRSDDATASWTDITPPGFEQLEPPLVALPGGVLLTAGGLAGGGQGIFRSNDRGASWSKVSDACCIYRLVSHPADPALVFATTWFQPGVLRSQDAGLTWQDLATVPVGLAATPSRPHVVSIVLHPTDVRTMYLGTVYDGVYKTSDGGARWTRAGDVLAGKAIKSLVLDPTDPTRIFAGTYEDGIYRSEDAGGQWRRLEMGQPNGQVFALAFDAGGTLYAGLYGWGLSVMKSTDRGVTWQDAAPQLRDDHVLVIAPHPAVAGRIYLGIKR